MKPLDGLRALSVLIIIVYHSVYVLGEMGIRSPAEIGAFLRSGILAPLWLAPFAVDVFFAMSGFLIGHILIAEHDRSGGISLWRFYRNRAFRLFPAYYVVLIVLFLIGRQNADTVWSNLLYVNNFLPWDRQFMPWAWTLAIEEQFYLTFPIFLVVLTRATRHRLAVLLVLLAIAPLIRAAVFHFSVAPGLADYTEALTIKPYTRYGTILCGVIAAYLVYYVKDQARLRRINRWVMAGLAAYLVAFIVVWATRAVSKDSLKLVLNATHHYYVAVALGWVMVASLHPTRFVQPLASFLSARAFFPIAQLSYSMYLVHPIVIERIYHHWYPTTATEILTIAGPLSLVASTLVALPLYLFVERPFMALRSRSA